jgi:hypothetical protein
MEGNAIYGQSIVMPNMMADFNTINKNYSSTYMRKKGSVLRMNHRLRTLMHTVMLTEAQISTRTAAITTVKNSSQNQCRCNRTGKSRKITSTPAGIETMYEQI